MSPRRTVILANSPARPRPATPPCAPTRSACGMSGFWTRQVRIRLFVLSGGHSGQFSRCAGGQEIRTVFSIRWRARERDVSGPDRRNGVPSYPAPPRSAARPCPAPTRPARGVSEFWVRQVVVVVVDLQEGSGSRRSKTPEVGALKTPVSK